MIVAHGLVRLPDDRTRCPRMDGRHSGRIMVGA
jgi:hypothetical protein